MVDYRELLKKVLSCETDFCWLMEEEIFSAEDKQILDDLMGEVLRNE